MPFAVAGVFDPHRHTRAQVARGNLQDALGPEASHAAHGSLALAWTPQGEPAHSGDLICHVHGRVRHLDLLRRELDAAAGASSGALVIAAYRRWGEAALERLRGEWIIVLGDRAAGTVLLARDQMGAQQLCLHASAGRVAFASEVHQLLRLLPRRPPPDDDVLAHWLAFSDPPPGRTPYEGVVRLRAAHVVRLGPGGMAERRYWSPRPSPLDTRSSQELADRLAAELTRAVRERCPPGGQTGLLLSGGLDSGAIAALGSRGSGAERSVSRAYSAVFPEHRDMDETLFIDATAASAHLPGARMRVTGGSMLAGALDYLEAWELPLVSHNLALWRPLLDRAAGQGTTVLFDGEGGDAILGVARYLIADRLRAGRPREAWALLRRLPGAGAHPSRRVLIRLAGDLGLKGALPAVVRARLRYAKSLLQPDPSWLRPRAAQALRRFDHGLAWQRAPGPRWSAHLVHALTEGLDSGGIQDHLRRRAAMAGLDAAHPFLDCDLLELVLGIPPETGFDPHLDRTLLRRGLAGLLPDAVRLRRDKTRFSALMVETLTRDDLPAIRRLLTSPHAEAGAYVDGERMRRELLDADPAGVDGGAVRWCYEVWRLVTAECWLRFQHDRDLPARVSHEGDLRPLSYRLDDVSP